jgi:transposase
LPELLELAPFGEKEASAVLNRIGGQPDKMLQYMKMFVGAGEHILMDATNVLSYSRQIDLAKKGYSNPLNFDPQYNLMYLYSVDTRMPVYYKLLPGNIREVKAFKNSLLEAGLQNATLIADKGFYSKANIDLLTTEQLQFILPLRRDNAIINYSSIKDNSFKQGANFFIHEKRPVWYQNQQLEGGLTLHLFLDEPLRVKEESDYLLRINTHPESHSITKYHQKKDHFGTIALLTNLQTTDMEAYQTYKSRMAIEVMFDGMKNILDADHTYMQNEQTLQGWMFVNHITLQWYQHLYIELKTKSLLKKISVNDYIQLLTDIKKIKINDRWYLNEYTNETKKLLNKLKITL